MKKYLFIIGLLFHVSILAIFLVGLNSIVSTDLPLPIFAEKTKHNIDKNYPYIAKVVSPILATISTWQSEIQYGFVVDPLTWQGVGANVNRSGSSTKDLEGDGAGKFEDDARYSSSNLGWNLEEDPRSVTSRMTSGDLIKVSSSFDLITALKTVKAGETIALLPGIYEISKSRINITNSGSKLAPIRLVSAKLGNVILKLKGEGFVVNKPYWQFENLHLVGHCTNHSHCEHAFHVVGKGSNVLFKNNIFQDFNAAIKVNGFEGYYPDNGKVIGNTFYNTTTRKTSNPVTPIDLMHANNWLVSKNFIFDFIKDQGNKVSYGAFFKGGSANGEFSNNLIMCNANLQSNSIAIGLSLGGGGSPSKWHRNGNAYEHSNGIIRNNIIMNCANDVGIYLNKASESIIANNILYNTMGVDIRFKESTATIRNNVLSGRIKERSKGSIIRSVDNIVLSRSWLTAAEPLNDLFYAPTNGDFTWIKSHYKNEGGEFYNSSVDFCGDKVNPMYIGVYARDNFCKNKMNLGNLKRKFKFVFEKKDEK